MLSKPEWAAPVAIADDVFIGSNVRIMKGVSIGAGAVIANSSVVVSDIPANCVAAGNPARVVKVFDTNE
jgi:acetyltransferase-like isoleucine patch superfamily enzyme